MDQEEAYKFGNLVEEPEIELSEIAKSGKVSSGSICYDF